MEDFLGISTVLVVESDANLMHVLQYHLTKAGLNVLTASTATQAVEQVEQRRVDLIVSETHMPDMHAMIMRKRMFMNPSLRDVPFLLLTETPPRNGEAMLFRAGLDEWVRKPFDPLHVLFTVGSILARRKVHEELLRIDPLTRLLNRISFETDVVFDLTRIKRYGRMASFALLDIDYFTEINEQHGYATGDLVLSTMGSTITANVRSVDLTGRHSGGRFLTYLPETDAQGTVALLERIQNAFAETTTTLIQAPIHFCAGIVEAPLHADTLEQLYHEAFTALGKAKKAGMGHIMVSDSEIGGGNPTPATNQTD